MRHSMRQLVFRNTRDLSSIANIFRLIGRRIIIASYCECLDFSREVGFVVEASQRWQTSLKSLFFTPLAGMSARGSLVSVVLESLASLSFENLWSRLPNSALTCAYYTSSLTRVSKVFATYPIIRLLLPSISASLASSLPRFPAS